MLGCANKIEAAKFDKIFAADGDEVVDLLKKHFREDKAPGGFNKFFEGITKKLFGEPKDPFDLTPGELERLTRVTKDTLDEFETRVVFRPEMFESGQINPDLHNEFADFYVQNKTFFMSPEDFQFDDATKTLYYKGRKNSLKRFLKQVGVKEDVISKILNKGAVNVFNKPIGLEDETKKKKQIGKYKVEITDLLDDTQDVFEMELLIKKSAHNFFQNRESKATIKGNDISFVGNPEDLKVWLQQASTLFNEDKIKAIMADWPAWIGKRIANG